MELYRFDERYVELLRAGDTAVERHFFAYFGELLRIKLHSRFLPHHLVDDLTQETFFRVLSALKREDGLRSPESLGAFVNSVCNNVLFEHYRGAGKERSLEDAPEPEDATVDMNRRLISEENRQLVRDVLRRMPERDRRLLQAVFIEERSKDQLCQQLDVDRNYLRVLLHRARIQFRERISARVAPKTGTKVSNG